MIVLDTNVVSEFSRTNPDPAVFKWLGSQKKNEVALCTPVIAELSFGAHRIKIKNGTERYLVSLENVIKEVAANGILDFDLNSARLYGEIRAQGDAAGQSRSQFDLMIAAICMSNGATLATRNIKDFDGLDLKLVNPFLTA